MSVHLNISIENDLLTLYKVSLKGDVHGLETLLQADELILDRVLTLTSFNETPLHIAAMRNHLHFAKAILARKPKLTHELDSLRRLPLHLASTEGYLDIVKELLHVNPNHACFARDEHGRIPLHLAAMKGRNEVVKELVKICPESVREKAENGGTILHLCVKYNQLETLKLLVELVEDDDDFVNASNDHGDTILHFASVFKQVEIAKYLISDTSMKIKANGLNMNGFTALDAVEHTPRDFKSLEIQIILLEAGVKKNKSVDPNNLQSSLQPPQSAPSDAPNGCFLTGKCKFWSTYYKNVGRRLEEARGEILVAATVTASLAYQSGVSPPQKASWHGNINSVEDYNVIDPIYEMSLKEGDKRFWYNNTMSMILSIVLILLMFSGIPFGNKLSCSLLPIIMCFIVLYISKAYFFATALNFPNRNAWYGEAGISLIVLGVVIPYAFYFILFLHVFTFLVFLVRKTWKRTSKLFMSR